MLRLGGPVFGLLADPDAWADAHARAGYSAAYCPVDSGAPDDVVRAYANAAQDADLVIAEVGAWMNPLAPDPDAAQTACEHCKKQLDLADRIGALCCVGIGGACGEQWDGPYPDNLTQATFERIVVTVRQIIDDVRPIRAKYTLETMPWMYPDSVESYERLVSAIARPAFGVHIDPVNLVCSPQRYFGNAGMIRDFFARLGPLIVSCHAKDIALGPTLTVHLSEVRPGLGALDYATFLEEAAKLPVPPPIMLEHLPDAAEYAQAAAHIRRVAAATGVPIR